MRSMALALTLIAGLRLSAQSPASNDAGAFHSLSFLEGRWSAATSGGNGVPNVIGSYTFRKELGAHIFARHSTSASCKAPTDFDCDHSDLLYVYADSPAQHLKAIYFDNEGHVIHYTVSTPTADSVEFLSDPAVPGPQFRLAYQLKDRVMSGRFQVHMPGQNDWKTYLEWSGVKQ